MATAISHVVYGEMIYRKLKNKVKNERDFFIGTLYPDIRYLAKVKREVTHKKPPRLFDLKKSAFDLGMDAHFLVDDIREYFIASEHAYDIVGDTENETVAALKLVEDKVLYSKISDWAKYIKFLTTVIAPEYEQNVPIKKAKAWHKGLIEYFREPPSEEVWQKLMIELNFKDKMTASTITRAKKMQTNPQILNLIDRTYDHFKNLQIETKN